MSIMNQLLRSEAVMTASEVFTYISFGSEVDTLGFIANCMLSGKKVYAPRVKEKGIMEFYLIDSLNQLIPGKYGILEPQSKVLHPFTGKGQIMVVPGVAFDWQKNRMGYGGGFYDRYFEKYPATMNHTMAVCYELQMITKVPCEAFDQKVNTIITEQNIY